MINKIQYLRRMPLDKNDVVIIGSAVLIAHGVDIINNDLDVVVKPEILNEYLGERNIRLEYGETYTPMEGIEITGDLSIIDKRYNQLNSKADVIEGYTFMSLLDLKAMYLALNRENDNLKIDIINRLLEESE